LFGGKIGLEKEVDYGPIWEMERTAYMLIICWYQEVGKMVKLKNGASFISWYLARASSSFTRENRHLTNQ
jgi:hypothetical protein